MNGTEVYEYLESLDDSKYVLHGSGEKIGIINPQQAWHYRGTVELNKFAVYGTLCVEIALLYAIIRDKHWGWNWQNNCSEEEHPLLIKLPKLQGGLKITEGYVHVVPKSSFVQLTPLVLYSLTRVTPVESLKVSPQDILRILKHDGMTFTTFDVT